MKTILISQGHEVMVDDSDFEYLSQFRWSTLKGRYTFYAFRMYNPDGTKKSRTSVLMHRLLLNTPKGMETDHIDGNGLNNQRSNLRIATISQNRGHQLNKRVNSTSRFKGVSWNSKRKTWIACIQKDKKFTCIGSFPSEIDAAKAYDSSAINLFGEFAGTNF